MVFIDLPLYQIYLVHHIGICIVCIHHQQFVILRVTVSVQEKPHMFQFVPNENQVCAKMFQIYIELKYAIGEFIHYCFPFRSRQPINY
jgi:hypothetical protein